MEEKEIGFGMVDSHKDAKVAKKLGEWTNKRFFLVTNELEDAVDTDVHSQAWRRKAACMFSKMVA